MKLNSPIAHKEAATMIMKIKNLQINSNAANLFKDVSTLTWSKGAVRAVADAKIMKGYSDGSFMPQSYIKRGDDKNTLTYNLC